MKEIMGIRLGGVIEKVSWIIVSILILVYSYKEGLGRLNDPGPGLFGFIVGLVLFPLVTIGLGGLSKESTETQFERLPSVLKVVISIVLFGVFLGVLGFLATTLIVSCLLFMDKNSLSSRFWAVAAISATAGLYILFVLLLRCNFPKGIL
jgi:putative tricarboxylic transport membrane protein